MLLYCIWCTIDSLISTADNMGKLAWSHNIVQLGPHPVCWTQNSNCGKKRLLVTISNLKQVNISVADSCGQKQCNWIGLWKCLWDKQISASQPEKSFPLLRADSLPCSVPFVLLRPVFLVRMPMTAVKWGMIFFFNLRELVWLILCQLRWITVFISEQFTYAWWYLINAHCPWMQIQM